MDRDPDDGIDNFVVFDKDNLNSDILFGQKPKFRAYWKEANGEEEILPVKWEMTEKNINSSPISIDNNKSLFPDTPFLEFNRGIDKKSELEGMSVHIGSFKLKVTSDESGKDGSLEITVTINSPSRLGTTFNNYDSNIIKYAHKYGIPPQYLKAHVHQEAKKRSGNYAADSFRYEPLSWDIGTEGSTSGGLLKGIWQWTLSEWNTFHADFSAYHYPDGSELSPAILEKIADFNKITSINYDPNNPNLPSYGCETYGTLEPPETATIVDVYNANNGWANGSYPNIAYGSNGPCGGRRERWDTGTFGNGKFMAYHNSKYYCNSENIPELNCDSTRCAFIEWFMNYPFIPAQVPIASSYGLMQVWYITAVDNLQWHRDGDSSSREPSLLLNPDESLDMGATFDSKEFGDKKIQTAGNISDFETAIRLGLAKYNRKSTYPNSVLLNVVLFPPQN
jgi:hypothetical protein